MDKGGIDAALNNAGLALSRYRTDDKLDHCVIVGYYTF